MNRRYLAASLGLVLVILSCNLPSAVTPTPTATTPSVTPSASLTPLPSATPLPTQTNTPTVPTASAQNVPVNCRFGPGTDWEAVGALLVGQSAPILGRNNSSTWWYVRTPNDPGTPCWVAASVTDAGGNIASVPVTAAPEALVTDVSVEVEPDDIALPGCVGPVEPLEITGRIHANGPLTVTYHFETEQSGAMASQTIEFDAYGTQTIAIDFSPPPGEGSFWIRLIVTDPDDETAETEYEIDC